MVWGTRFWGRGEGCPASSLTIIHIIHHNGSHLGEDGGDTEEEEAGHDHDDGCDVETK